MASMKASSATPASPRPQKPNYNSVHARPLPLQTYPLPAFIPHNPLSLLRIAYAILSQTLFPPSSHAGPELPGRPRHLPRGTYVAHYDATTRSVHVTDGAAIRGLWEQGFFGKGSLSRSEPEWLQRERWKQRKPHNVTNGSVTSADVTRKRREERREEKRVRAKREAEAIEEQLRLEREEDREKVMQQTSESLTGKEVGEEPKENGLANGKANSHTHPPPRRKSVHFEDSIENSPATVIAVPERPINPPLTHAPSTEPVINQEHLQLSPTEAFFLVYGLGILTVIDPTSKESISSPSLLDLFRRTSYFPPLPEGSSKSQTDDPFLLSYVVYHHFRSLGWVVRPGVKFAVDFLLYNRGPVFAHAEFAVLILPSYSNDYWRGTEARRAHVKKRERKDWWWLHCANRVQTQVRKSLVLVYVDVPPPPETGNDDIGGLLRQYKVREFVIKRWTINRNRD